MKKLISTFKFQVLLAASLIGALNAHAHYVWIEDTASHELIVRFAEWPDEYESSPGHLDEVSLPNAWKWDAAGEPVSLKAEKKTDQFLINAVATDAVQLETGFQVMSSTNGPSRKPYFYARWQPAGSGAAKPNLNFDIVPTANKGEYQVYLRGEPLGGVKVTAHLPDGKDQKLTADNNGIVHFTGDKPGLYMLSCAHQREIVKGFSDGVPFDQVSHNCSLTWRQP